MIIQREDGYIHILEGPSPASETQLCILVNAEVHIISRGRCSKDTIADVCDERTIRLNGHRGNWTLSIVHPVGSESYVAQFWRKNPEHGMEFCYLACEYSQQRYDAYHQRRAVAEAFIRMRQEADALSLNIHKATEEYIVRINRLSKAIRALREDLSKK